MTVYVSRVRRAYLRRRIAREMAWATVVMLLLAAAMAVAGSLDAVR